MGFPHLADIISDGLLLYFPTRQFTRIQDQKLRFRLTVIYGSCVLTTLTSFVHAAYLLKRQLLFIAISAVVEVSPPPPRGAPNLHFYHQQTTVSVIVCNVPVLVTAVFKLKEEDELPSNPDRLPTPPMPILSIDGQETIALDDFSKIDSPTTPRQEHHC